MELAIYVSLVMFEFMYRLGAPWGLLEVGDQYSSIVIAMLLIIKSNLRRLDKNMMTSF